MVNLSAHTRCQSNSRRAGMGGWLLVAETRQSWGKELSHPTETGGAYLLGGLQDFLLSQDGSGKG